MASLLSAVLLSLVCTAYGAVGPVTNLNIVNKVIAPDGFNRSAVLADGVFPGPLIKGNKGSRFVINVTDSLVDPTMVRSTSIHWHGIFQSGSIWADGVSFVTQCPIIPNNSFVYDFTVPDQAGTFWYHSHLSTQYCDGLRGPFVVYDPNDPYAHLYDVDDESTIITLADWYHKPAPQLTGKIPSSNATLINGKGRYAENPSADLSVINVEHGKRYRIRLVSMSCDPNFNFTIDGHNFTIIEVDGINTEKLVVDSIQIFAAQRYSFILNANQPIGNYWVRANPNNGNTGFAGNINSAILRYLGAPLQDPTTLQIPSISPLLETNLHPLENPGAPGKPEAGGADHTLVLNLGVDVATASFTINNHAFTSPSVPVLLQILSGAKRAQDLLPSGSVYSLPPNKVIEIQIPSPTAAPGGPHPFHLHGHAFDVVRSAGSNVTNYKNPVRRDVVSVGGSGDDVTIRFVTDNAGPMFFHCHIDFHLQAGLAIVFAEDIPGTKYRNPTPADWNSLCPIYDAGHPDDSL